MTEPDKAAALTPAVVKLTAEVTRLAGEVEWLRRYGRRNRLFIAVDVVLTVGLSLSGALAVHASQSASHAAQSAARANSAQLALCRAGNVARAQQIGLWDYVIARSPPPKTAQARAVIVQFQHHLEVIFQARDCTYLGQHPAPSPSSLPPPIHKG